MFFKGCDKKLNCSYGQEHRISDSLVFKRPFLFKFNRANAFVFYTKRYVVQTITK